MRRWRGRKRKRDDGRRRLAEIRDQDALERDRELTAIARRESIEIHNARRKASNARGAVWKRWYERKRKKATA